MAFSLVLKLARYFTHAPFPMSPYSEYPDACDTIHYKTFSSRIRTYIIYYTYVYVRRPFS